MHLNHLLAAMESAFFIYPILAGLNSVTLDTQGWLENDNAAYGQSTEIGFALSTQWKRFQSDFWLKNVMIGVSLKGPLRSYTFKNYF